MANLYAGQQITVEPADQDTVQGISTWNVYRIIDSVEEGSPIAVHTVTPEVIAGSDPETEETLQWTFSYNHTVGEDVSAGETYQLHFVPTDTEADLAATHDWLSDEYDIIDQITGTVQSGLSLAMAIGL